MEQQQGNIFTMFKGKLFQLTVTFVASMSAISDGMHYGWTSPVIPILKSENSPIKIEDSDEIWLENIYLIAGLVGLPITIYLVDKIGRHKSIVVSSFTSLIAWVIIGLANSVELLYVARFVTGVAADVAFVATPMYVAEIADHTIRGFLSSLIYLMMLFGILVIYVVVPYVPFYAPSIMASILLVLQLVLMIYIPESPYFLISKNQHASAWFSLMKLRPPDSDIDKELEEIETAVLALKEEKGRPQDLFTVSANRKVLLISCVLTFAQHFGGITVILMNLHSILAEAGSIYMEANLTAIVFSVVMFTAAMAASLNIDKYGRKIVLTSSCFLTSLSLLVLAIYFNLKSAGCDMQNSSWIPLVCVMVYGGVFKAGLGLLPVVIISEMFSNKIKATGMSVGDGLYVAFAALSIEFYKKVYTSLGIYVPFYCFSLVALLTAVFSACYVPETKGKTLDEIQTLIQGHKWQIYGQERNGDATAAKLQNAAGS